MSKALNHLDKHFILYSKNHYKRVDDSLTDLARIVEKSCALPENYSNEYKVYELLSETFSKVANEFMFREFFKRLFCKYGSLKVSEANYQYAGELMLGHIQSLKIMDGDRIIWDIGSADPEVWDVQ